MTDFTQPLFPDFLKGKNKKGKENGNKGDRKLEVKWNGKA